MYFRPDVALSSNIPPGQISEKFVARIMESTAVQHEKTPTFMTDSRVLPANGHHYLYCLQTKGLGHSHGVMKLLFAHLKTPVSSAIAP